MAPFPGPGTGGPLQRSFSFGDEPEPAAPAVPGPTNAIIHRIRPPVKAHGGKYYLARRIVPILLGVRERITEYLEPCAFGGSVFLAMPRLQREILGDVNPDVVALWTVLSGARSAGELSDRLRDVSYNRPTFERARHEGSGTLIEQTTRFLIRCRFSRGGLGQAFAWSERQRGGRPGDENLQQQDVRFGISINKSQTRTRFGPVYRPGGQGSIDPMGNGKIRILFVSANPEGTVRLSLDEEVREITAKIRDANPCRCAQRLLLGSSGTSDRQ
jgi:hypothetical protein